MVQQLLRWDLKVTDFVLICTHIFEFKKYIFDEELVLLSIALLERE